MVCCAQGMYIAVAVTTVCPVLHVYIALFLRLGSYYLCCLHSSLPGYCQATVGRLLLVLPQLA